MALSAAVLADGPAEYLPPMPAGVWAVTLMTAQGKALLAGPSDHGPALSPLGQVVASIWSGLALEYPGVALGDFAILPDGLRALLYVPWEGSSRALGAIIAQFKALVASTANRAGLMLEHSVWQTGFDGRLIEDAIELAACRSTIKANKR